MADNIYVDFNGDAYVTGSGNGLLFVKSCMDDKVHSPTLVSKVSENTDSDLFYGKRYKSTTFFEDDGAKISTGSIAVISLDGKKLALGGVMSKGILVCDI